jgi:hypothetical protein
VWSGASDGQHKLDEDAIKSKVRNIDFSNIERKEALLSLAEIKARELLGDVSLSI